MENSYFIKGYKVNLHVGFNCATVEIYVKRRVGQLSKLYYKDQKIYADVRNNYDVYRITLDTTEYRSPYELLRSVMDNIQVATYANIEHPRFIQELYRALS